MSRFGALRFVLVTMFAIFLFLSSVPSFNASARPTLTCSTPVDVSGSPPVATSTLTNEAADPAISGNMLYLVWSTTGATGTMAQVFLAVSGDLGATFGSPVLLSDPTTNSRNVKVVATGADVYVTWLGNHSIYFRASHDSGSTWGPMVVLSGAGTSIGETITASSTGNVLVSWAANSSLSASINNVFKSVSHDHGDSFQSNPQLLSIPGDNAKEISVASSDDHFYVTWVDTSLNPAPVYFTASSDEGDTFSPPTDVSKGTAKSLEPILSATNGNGYVFVAWREQFSQGDSEAFIVLSSDYGGHFGATVNLADNHNLTREVTLASSGANVYVIWRNPVSGTYRLYLTASYDGGASFTTPKDLSGRTGIKNVSYQYTPYITVVPGRSTAKDAIWITWDAVVAHHHDVFVRESLNSGKTFSGALNVSNDAGDSWNQLLAATQGSSVVMWLDGSAQTHFDVLTSACS